MPNLEDRAVSQTPWCDMGSLLRLFLNPLMHLRAGNKPVPDGIETVVVGSGKYDGADVNGFLARSTSKLLYFSYRNCFSKLPDGSTTDVRWGCLVRTGQMVLGQILMRHHANGCSIISELDAARTREHVQPLFMDTPDAPFGLHQIEFEANQLGISYATWLSPTQIAKAIHAAFLKYHMRTGSSPYPLCCEDRDVDKQQVLSLLQQRKSVALLIPVVLGVKLLNQKYQAVLLHCLEMECMCGVAGGCNKASYYMYGHQGPMVFFLDPHYVQGAYVSTQSAGKVSGERGTVSVDKINPCMLLGFYIADEAAWERFCKELQVVNSLVAFPLIRVLETRPLNQSALEKEANRIDVICSE